MLIGKDFDKIEDILEEQSERRSISADPVAAGRMI